MRRMVVPTLNGPLPGVSGRAPVHTNVARSASIIVSVGLAAAGAKIRTKIRIRLRSKIRFMTLFPSVRAHPDRLLSRKRSSRT
jgi:hypothetical protein